MLILELLKYAASDSPDPSAERVVDALTIATDREFCWALDAGLGPLLLHATKDRVPSKWRDIVLSADLTSQIQHGCRIETAKEVIDICTQSGAPITLLKGISLGEQCYPDGHLRGMTDIDVLVPVEACPEIESRLIHLGYRAAPWQSSEDWHHGAPLHDAKRRVWVELHTALFPISSGLLANSALGDANIAEQTVNSTFHDRPVRRLNYEFQFVYLASSWILDLTLRKIHPTFVTALFDAVYLQKSAAQFIDWKHILTWLDNDLAEASLRVMLSYLSRHGLCAAPIIPLLHERRRLMGRVEMQITHAVLDRYLLGARRWNQLLPPPVPGRYNLRRQIRKRGQRIFKRLST